MEIVHYGITVQERAARTGKHPSCYDDKYHLAALCGNGNYHTKTTRAKRFVTCPACKAKLGVK